MTFRASISRPQPGLKYLGLAVLLAAPAFHHLNYLNHAARAQSPSLLKSLLKPFVGPQNASSWKFGDEAKGWSMEEDAEEEGAFSLRSSQGAASKGSISQAVDVGPGALVVAGEAKGEGKIEGAQWDAQVFDAAWKQIAWISSEESDAFKLAIAPEWKPFRREIALPEKTAHLVFYISARGSGAITLRRLSLAPAPVDSVVDSVVESTNPNANTKILDTARVQVLSARPYRWKSLLTGGVEYATGLVWSPKSPRNLFLRADGGGIWKLDRRGDPKNDRWVALMDNLPWKWSNMATIDSLAVDPNNSQVLFVAAGSSRWGQPHDLLKTSDGGKNWARLNLKNARGEDVISEGNGPDKQAGERLVVDPNDSRVLFFGSRNDGLFTSNDAGKTWRLVNSLPSRGAKWTGISFVLLDASSGTNSPSHSPSQVLYVGVHAGKSSDQANASDVEGGVFQSRDGGRSWRKLEGQTKGETKGGAPSTHSPMRARIGAGGALLVTYVGGGSWEGGAGGGVWKWRGGAWSEITPPEGKGQPFCGLNIDPRDARRVVCAGTYTFGANVFLSRDGGSTWSHRRFEKGNKPAGSIFLTEYPIWEKGPDQEWGGNASDVAFDAGDPDAIWHLSFSGPTRLKGLNSPQWKASIVGAGREQMTTAEGVSPSAGAPFISGTWDVGGFRYEEKDFDKIPSARLAVRKPDGSAHLGYETYRNGFQDIFDMDASPQMPDFVVAVGGWMWNHTGDAAISSDNGRTFRVTSGKPFPQARFGRIAISARDARNLVWAPLGSNSEPVYFSRDGGATWATSQGAPRGMVNLELESTFFKPLCADRVLENTFYIYDRRSGKFFKSTDGGATWAHQSTLPTQLGAHYDQHKLEAVPGSASELWLSLWDRGLFHSRDGGSTWSRATGVDWAVDIAFGKPMPGRQNATIFLAGQVNGADAKIEEQVDASLLRSDDGGKSWTKINGSERGLAQIRHLTGDMQKAGRVYFGTGGRGTFVGEP